jgi:hypothetical protein
MDLLSVNLNLSTAFHPQTDGQTERVNQVLEGYMASYCSYQQDHWVDLLPLAQYAYNCAISEATMFSSCWANYGLEVATNWPNPKPSPECDNPASGITVSQWETKCFVLKENLANTRLGMTPCHNSSNLQGPEFSPGDEVMLDRPHVKTKWPINKLDYKKFGPFIVKKPVAKIAL